MKESPEERATKALEQIAAQLKRIADSLDPPVAALDSGGTGDGPPGQH